MVDTSSPKGQVSTKPGQLHYAYLRHVFTELPKAQSLAEVEALLPTRLDSDTLTRHSLQGPLSIRVNSAVPGALTLIRRGYRYTSRRFPIFTTRTRITLS